MEQQSSLPVTETFLITIITAILGAMSGLCVCMLKSRCTQIKCCGVQVDRNVLPPGELNNIDSQNLDGV